MGNHWKLLVFIDILSVSFIYKLKFIDWTISLSGENDLQISDILFHMISSKGYFMPVEENCSRGGVYEFNLPESPCLSQFNWPKASSIFNTMVNTFDHKQCF